MLGFIRNGCHYADAGRLGKHFHVRGWSPRLTG